MTYYLGLADVLRIAERVLSAPPVVRDYGLLELALLRPQSTVLGHDAYPSEMEKAAALLQSLAGNRALLDGNKGTALVTTLTFLELNGLSTGTPDTGAAVDLVLSVVRREVDGVEDIGRALHNLLA